MRRRFDTFKKRQVETLNSLELQQQGPNHEFIYLFCCVVGFLCSCVATGNETLIESNLSSINEWKNTLSIFPLSD